MHVHEEVLAAANRIAGGRPDCRFAPDEIVRALPHLNVSSVRTHVVSRCCVNAPKHHLHKWGYFRRVERGVYELMPAYRNHSSGAKRKRRPVAVRQGNAPALRDTIHVMVSRDGAAYVAECAELAVVTQGASLDELVANVREALALHLEGEEYAQFGLREHPRLQLIYDLPRAI
jgi:predicted RNase H-like HicB family nuclease